MQSKKYGVILFGLSLLQGWTCVTASQLTLPAPAFQLTTPQYSLAPTIRKQIQQPVLKNTSLRRNKSQSAVKRSKAGIKLPHSLVNKIGAVTKTSNKPQAVIPDAQHLAFEKFKQTTALQGGLRAFFDKVNGTPTYMEGQLTEPMASTKLKPGVKKESLAIAFFKDNSALFKLKNPEDELKLVNNLTDSNGNLHLQFQQTHAGVPVWGKQAMVHLDKDNRIYLFNGRYNPSLQNLNAVPNLSPDEALSVVQAELNAKNLEVLSNEIVFYSLSGKEARLVYKLDVRVGLLDRWLYFIDAHKGETVKRIRNIHTSGSVVSASGADLLGNTQNFNAWSEGGNFFMIDPTLPTAEIPAEPTKTPGNNGDTYIFNAENTEQIVSIATSNALTSGWDASAVSAMANTRIVYQYWLDTHQRKSIDDKNKNLLAVIHAGQNHNNASWNGNLMIYGDGDNQTFSLLAKCLDVAGHEMSHGVIEHTAHLIYENQSGALNESFADVFGAMVDREDWFMGEDCTIPAPGYLRNMQNPADALSPQPATMSQFKNLPNTEDGDNGGVHVNSGIPNRAAYLVAEGLTAEGLGSSIGRSKLEKIWYKALKEYLVPSSQFIDARRATIQAAKDLFGNDSAEANAVAKAWDVVEVTETGVATTDTSAPSTTDVIDGADLLVYLFPTDGTHDRAETDAYDIYAQFLTPPSYQYDPELDFKLNKNISAAYTRPAAFTKDDNTGVFFVGVDSNLWFSDGEVETQLTDTQDIWSIAISPDAKYFAYTSTEASDDQIHVVNLETEIESTYELAPPDYQQGKQDVGNTIFFADSLNFDFTGNLLVFDALNCISLEQNACATDDGGYRYWSVGVLDISSGSITYPFPDQDPAIDIGNPMFAANNSYVIALDVQDHSGFETNGTVSSGVVAMNFDTQQVTSVIEFDDSTEGYLGVPSFWGDDSGITLQVPDAANGAIAIAIPLDENWNGLVDSAVIINPNAVAFPVMHRAGQRVLSGALQLSANSLNFGDLTEGSVNTQVLTLRNQGNRDVSITDINLSGNAFSHNATNIVIPRNAVLSVSVSVKPGLTPGTQQGSLTLTTDGEPSTVTIALSANIVANQPAPSEANKDSSSGGCSLGTGHTVYDPVLWVLMLLALIGINRRYLFSRVRIEK